MKHLHHDGNLKQYSYCRIDISGIVVGSNRFASANVISRIAARTESVIDVVLRAEYSPESLQGWSKKTQDLAFFSTCLKHVENALDERRSTVLLVNANWYG